MRYDSIICGLFIATSLFGGTDPVTPQSYSLSFVDVGLPAQAKVVGVSLEIDGADGVRIRRLPSGWSSWTFRSRISASAFSVGLDYFPWGDDKGVPLDVTALDDRVWICPRFESDDRPKRPQVSVRLDYILPADDGKKSVTILRRDVPASSIKMTYIP